MEWAPSTTARAKRTPGPKAAPPEDQLRRLSGGHFYSDVPGSPSSGAASSAWRTLRTIPTRSSSRISPK